jgi:hypothetical protein
MKLWLISQDINTGYDTYDSAVVAAEDEASAKLIHPSGDRQMVWRDTGHVDRDYGAWTSKEHVQCRYLGEATSNVEAGVICASFNAG